MRSNDLYGKAISCLTRFSSFLCSFSIFNEIVTQVTLSQTGPRAVLRQWRAAYQYAPSPLSVDSIATESIAELNPSSEYFYNPEALVDFIIFSLHYRNKLHPALKLPRPLPDKVFARATQYKVVCCVNAHTRE
eukprot:4526980-Amphidinium_carterae.1